MKLFRSVKILLRARLMLNGGGQGLFDDYIKVSLIKSVTVSKKEYKYAKSRDAIYGRPLSFFVELLST